MKHLKEYKKNDITEAPKIELTPEAAQKQVDAAKGNYIELDAEVGKRLIDRRNEDGGKKFKEWVESIKKGSERLQYARQDMFKDFQKYLTKNEQDIVGKGADKLVLSQENWKENLAQLYGIVRKLHVFQNITVKNRAKDPDGAYLGDLDRIVALVKDKSPLEAGQFVEAYYQVRYNLGILQREGSLDQTEVNAYLVDIDLDPAGTMERIKEDIYEKEQAELGNLLPPGVRVR